MVCLPQRVSAKVHPRPGGGGAPGHGLPAGHGRRRAWTWGTRGPWTRRRWGRTWPAPANCWWWWTGLPVPPPGSGTGWRIPSPPPSPRGRGSVSCILPLGGPTGAPGAHSSSPSTAAARTTPTSASPSSAPPSSPSTTPTVRAPGAPASGPPWSTIRISSSRTRSAPWRRGRWTPGRSHATRRSGTGCGPSPVAGGWTCGPLGGAPGGVPPRRPPRDEGVPGNDPLPRLPGGAKRYKQYIRVFLRQYQSPTTCPACRGTKLRPEALRVRVGGKTSRR
jgi:hypothetical protein